MTKNKVKSHFFQWLTTDAGFGEHGCQAHLLDQFGVFPAECFPMPCSLPVMLWVPLQQPQTPEFLNTKPISTLSIEKSMPSAGPLK